MLQALKIIEGKKLAALLQVVFLFVIPVLLIYFDVLPIEKRFLILVVFVILITTIILKEKWSLKRLGIRVDNLKASLVPYLVFTLVVVAIIILLAFLLGHGFQETWWQNPHFKYFILPVSIFQEFAYRGFLMPKLKILFGSLPIVIVVNAFLYALLHIIFPDALFTFFLTFILGLGFAALYQRYPNLLAISVSHFIINFFAVIFCFVSFSTC